MKYFKLLVVYGIIAMLPVQTEALSSSTLKTGALGTACFVAGLYAKTIAKYLFSGNTKTNSKDSPVAFISFDATKSSWEYVIPLNEVFTNPEIKVIVLLTNGRSQNYGMAYALHAIIKQYKTIYPKLVISYSEENLLGSLYSIASAADEMYAAPGAWVGGICYGFEYKRIHAKNEEEGIESNLVYRGLYKPLTCQECPITEEYKKMIQQVVDDIYKEVVTSTKKVRPQLNHLDEALWADGMIVSAECACSSFNLIDKIVNKLELIACINDRLKTTEKSVSMPEIKTARPLATVAFDLGKTHIGIASITGEIPYVAECPNKTGWDYLPPLIELFSNPCIEGIVIALNTGGGNSILAKALYNDIIHLKQTYKKPVIAYIEGSAISMGYYIACAADYIIASNTSLTGCIGLKWNRFDRSKKNQKEHTDFIFIKAGEHADIFNVNAPFTEQKRTMVQNVIDSSYNTMIDMIKTVRPTLAANDSLWKEAQYFETSQAIKLGLIDQIGSQIEILQYFNKVNKNRTPITLLNVEFIQKTIIPMG